MQTNRKVAVQLCQCRHSSNDRSRQSTDLLPFHPAKEEQFIFDNRPAKAETKIVIAKCRPKRGERVPGIQFVIAQKFECAAVKCVSTAFRNDIDLRACVASVFSREVRGLNLHFLNKINAYVVDLTGVAAGLLVRTAVDRQIIHLTSIAVN